MRKKDLIDRFKLGVGFLIFALIIGIVDQCSGQIEKCKYLRNEIDDMTGKRFIQTRFYHIAKTQRGNSAVWASVKKVDNDWFLEIYNTNEDLGCIGISSEVIFKTVSNQIYSLTSSGGRQCDDFVYYGVRIPPLAVLHLSGTNSAIKNEGIEMIRFSYERKSDDAKLFLPFNIQQICKCVETAPAPKKKKLKRQTI